MEFINIINAIIFGIIQGITEFLPISSSGHLVVLHNFLNIPTQNELNFDIFLHLASLLAVISFFYKDIFKLIKGFFDFKNKESNKYYRLSRYLLVATIPAAAFGFFFDDLIESVLRNNWTVAIMLIFIGILFIIVETKINKDKTHLKSLRNLNWKQSILIGFAQSIALIPGTSRSGITIITGLFLGLKRVEAIRFSFLLSIPIIAGASLLKLPKVVQGSLSSNEVIILMIACVTCFITSFLTIKYFLKFAQIYSFKCFAYYRFALAVGLIIFIFYN